MSNIKHAQYSLVISVLFGKEYIETETHNVVLF